MSVKVAKFSFYNEKSYNKTVIDPYVHLTEVNTCIILVDLLDQYIFGMFNVIIVIFRSLLGSL